MKYFKKCVQAGDHLQLPPVVKTSEAVALGSQKSCMEWAVETLPTRHFKLDTQYRSHVNIMRWSGKGAVF